MASPETYGTPGAAPPSAGWDANGNFAVPGNLTVTGNITGPNTVDSSGHPVKMTTVALTAAAVGVTTAGTIAGTTNAGAAPTVTGVAGDDRQGTFVLNPVTGGGAQAAGIVATVTFTRPYAVAPSAVIVRVVDITTATNPLNQSCCVLAANITTAGFSISTAVLTTAHNYQVSYQVMP